MGEIVVGYMKICRLECIKYVRVDVFIVFESTQNGQKRENILLIRDKVVERRTKLAHVTSEFIPIEHSSTCSINDSNQDKAIKNSPS